MKSIIRLFCTFALTATLGLIGTDCTAQNPDNQREPPPLDLYRPEPQKRMEIQEVLQMKRKYIEEHFALNKANADEFWKIYDKYLADESVIHNSFKVNLESKGITYERLKDATVLNDEQVALVLEQKMILREAMLTLDKRFYNEMKKILTSREIFRFYELENNFKNESRRREDPNRKPVPPPRPE